MEIKDNYRIKLVETSESAAFYNLISSNALELKLYFPNTVKENQTQQDAEVHLVASHEKMQNKEKYLFGLYKKEVLIGYVNVKNFDWEVPKCELGYFIDKAHSGQGLATRMVGEVTDYCFRELKLIKVFLRIAKENVASIKIAEKNGFIHEGSLRSEFRLESGELIDVEYYGKLKISNLRN